jgi:hypothetical protein
VIVASRVSILSMEATSRRSSVYIFSIAHDERAVVQSVAVNGREVVFTRQDNPYRQGGAMIRRAEFHALLSSAANVVSVHFS